MSHDPRSLIRARARTLGFDAIAFCDIAAVPDGRAALSAFVADGRHGDMAWLAATAARRAHPQRLWPDARAAVVVGVNYGPDDEPLAILARTDRAAISVYGRHRDYHDVVKGRLKQLAGWMHRQFDCDVKVFVDTAPVMEKPLAQAAGIGWQGKHTNLVSKAYGSWLFLGEILTTLPLGANDAGDHGEHCGTCTRCLDICPTEAFTAPHEIDARRCISYLTIEHKGHIPRPLRPLIGNRIYGCDDCLAVCPWNKFAAAATDAKLVARAEMRAPMLSDLAGLDDAAFRNFFAGSPIKRIGRDRFIRNVLIAIGNSGTPKLAAAARPHLHDPAPLVRVAAVWAVGRLLPKATVAALAVEALVTEHDPNVRAEWAGGGA